MITKARWGDASTLLAKAGVQEDTSYYGQFTAPDEKAALTACMRVQAAWAANDADAFAEVFTDNGSLLMQDNQLVSREEIREYMAQGFAGGLKGARVKGWPVEVKFLSEDVAMVVTEGGIIMAGETDIAAENLIRATWVIVRQPDGQVRLVSHQSSPVKS
ncbi:SgcJ/EcaC family oxidoreductase [Micromonospora echinofusca]|uniref:SgcJ/EcaC family oxidoreductase n=1 Tax=Micromonospora echinofusca TaxID=47858 RepID=UPI00343BDD20